MTRTTLIAAAALLLAGCGQQADAGANAAAHADATTTATVADPAPAPPPAGLSALAGAWTVTAVHVDTSGVSALSENDPADMGAVLDVSPGKLAWRPHPAGGTFDDACTGPSLAADGTVACRDGQFGPPGAHLVRQGGGLRLDWYDGGVLILHRGG